VLYNGCLCSGGAGTVKYHSQLLTTPPSLQLNPNPCMLFFILRRPARKK
jgi:hypothetical protein